MKIIFIATVYNETQTINAFLASILEQTRLPDEVVIVDGGSTDATFVTIKKKLLNIKAEKLKKITFKVLVKKGNRSVGRNEAVKNATGDIIVCSDSGNKLDKNWIKNITKPFNDPKIDVVAGYYKGLAKTIFQKCVIPYALVMPDKVDPENFLPATRSIAFKKSIWKKVGGFDESLSHNEDYVFARKLKEKGARIVFAKDAIVYWLPRNNLKQTYIMLWRFALGDAEAGIVRNTVILLFARYILGSYFFSLCILYRSITGLLFTLLLIISYSIWSIRKNYRYVNDSRALYILPVLQFTADVAVISGSLLGALKRLKNFSIWKYIKDNKALVTVLFIYTFILLLTLRWGTPSEHHPFPYHMDEWHQLQAVANTFRYGTPNTEGSANGTMLYFLLSGFYLIPFTLLQLINPFDMQIENGTMREKVFEVLRLQTILFGLLSTIIFYHILKFLKTPRIIPLLLFTLTPVWLMLSNYFKYDIALMFFILLTTYFLLKYIKQPGDRNFLLISLPAGLAVAVKVSAIPLLAIYMLVYFLFHKNKVKHLKTLISGLIIFLGIVLLFGLPDTLFGRGNMLYYLYDNLHETPTASLGYNLNSSPLLYIFITQVPVIFGYGLITAFLLSLVYWIFSITAGGLRKGLKEYKYELFILLSFALFLLSLLPLQMYAGGNRSLVLLPFIVLSIASVLKYIQKTRVKNIITVLFLVIVAMQAFQTFGWLYIKFQSSPHHQSSEWIKNNISKDAIIGIENIPIYQHLPDRVQKDFYFKEYKVTNYIPEYRYLIVDEKSKILPGYVIITNAIAEQAILKDSSKNRLVNRLEKEKYRAVTTFIPDFSYYKTFGNEIEFYTANIVPMPLTITIYKK